MKHTLPKFNLILIAVSFLVIVIGFALMMVYSVKRRERYHVGKVAAVVLTLFTYVFGVAGALTMGKTYSAVSTKISVSKRGIRTPSPTENSRS